MPQPLLSRDTRSLPCELSDATTLVLSEQLAGMIADLDAQEEIEKARRKEYQADRDEIESMVRELARKVRRREETRDVDCEVRAYLKSGTACTIRLDTGEVLHERPLTPEERQGALPLKPILKQVVAQVNAGALDSKGVTVTAEVGP